MALIRPNLLFVQKFNNYLGRGHCVELTLCIFSGKQKKCQIVRAITLLKHATILNMPGAALGPSA